MKLKTFILFINGLLLIPGITSALEIVYPVIPGVASPSDLPSFLNYLFYFSFSLGVVSSVLAMLWGGASYVLSFGNPSKTIVSKRKIFSGLTGLGILVMAYFLLNFLNPDLAKIKLPGITPAPIVNIAPIPDPEGIITEYWELPLENLEQDVLDKTYALVSPNDLPKNVKDAVKTLQDRSQALETMLKNQCKCSNLFSVCSANNNCASGSQCAKNSNKDAAEQKDLCTDLNSIKAQQNLIETDRQRLKSAWKNLWIARINLQIATVRMATGKELLANCLPTPTDLKSFQEIKDQEGTKVRKFFTDIKVKNEPMTVYCQLNEEFADIAGKHLASTIAILDSQKDYEIDNWESVFPPPGPIPTGPMPPPPGPISGTCLNFVDSSSKMNCAGVNIQLLPWGENPATMNLMASAANTLANWPTFLAFACTSEIKIYRGYSPGWIGGCAPSGSIIILENIGQNYSTYSPKSALWTLTHEIGHQINYRHSNLMGFFKGLTGSEGFLPSYPYTSSYSEDFPETIGIYPVSPYRNVDLNQWPGHLKFAKYIFLGEQ